MSRKKTLSKQVNEEGDGRMRGLRFVKRIYFPRILGLGIGFFCVFSVFIREDTSAFAWALLIFNGFIWPHVAYFRSLKSKNPYQTEKHNLLLESLKKA